MTYYLENLALMSYDWFLRCVSKHRSHSHHYSADDLFCGRHSYSNLDGWYRTTTQPLTTAVVNQREWIASTMRIFQLLDIRNLTVRNVDVVAEINLRTALIITCNTIDNTTFSRKNDRCIRQSLKQMTTTLKTSRSPGEIAVRSLVKTMCLSISSFKCNRSTPPNVIRRVVPLEMICIASTAHWGKRRIVKAPEGQCIKFNQ